MGPRAGSQALPDSRTEKRQDVPQRRIQVALQVLIPHNHVIQVRVMLDIERVLHSDGPGGHRIVLQPHGPRQEVVPEFFRAAGNTRLKTQPQDTQVVNVLTVNACRSEILQETVCQCVIRSTVACVLR
jgi:hypothetical protein